MAAYEARFVNQTHPRLPNLVGWKMADRVVDEQRGLETYVRTITVAGDVPWLVARATGLETLEIVQTVEVDRFRRRINMVSKNTTWRDRLQMDEDCSYFADPNEPAWTGFKQTASLAVSLGGYGIESTVEGFLISAYSDGIDKVRLSVDFDALVTAFQHLGAATVGTMHAMHVATFGMANDNCGRRFVFSSP